MGKRKILFYIGYFIVALVLLSLIKSVLAGEKGKIKRVIFSAKSALEKRDLVALSNVISYDYQDEYGNERQMILLIAQSFFAEYQDIAVQINDLEIELGEQERASAQMEVLVLARSSTAQAAKDSPLEYDKAKIRVELRKEEDSWRVIGVKGLESEKTYPMEKFMRISRLDSFSGKSL